MACSSPKVTGPRKRPSETATILRITASLAPVSWTHGHLWNERDALDLINDYDCAPAWIVDHFLADVLAAFKFETHYLMANADFEALWDHCHAFHRVLSDRPDFVIHYGDVLCLADRFMEARQLFSKLATKHPSNVIVCDRLENCNSALVSRWHFPMLNDAVRNAAFATALTHMETLTVLDVGTGTGLLAMYAKKSGADKVFACEADDTMANICVKVLAENDFTGSVHFIPKLSTQLSLEDLGGSPVDVLVTETFDAGLLGEHALEIIDHAWKNLLKPTGKIIPARAKVSSALIRCPRIKSKYHASGKFCSLDLSPFRLMANLEEPYTSEDLRKTPHQFLTDSVQLTTINFEDRDEVSKLLRHGQDERIVFKCINGGQAHAVAIWFELDLGRNVTVGNSVESNTCWQQAIFPLEHPRSVLPGQELEVHVHIDKHIQVKLSISKREEEPDKQLMIPCETIQSINSKEYAAVVEYAVNYIKNCFHKNDTIEILDPGNFGLLSLQILKSCPNSNLTMLFDRSSEDAKKSLDFVCEVALANGISDKRISGISKGFLDENTFDVIMIDPVDKSGRLRCEVLQELEEVTDHLNERGIFLPGMLKVKMCLVESKKLKFWSSMNPDNEVTKTGPFQIASYVNEYSSKHLRDVDIKSVDFKAMSNEVDLVTLDLKSIDDTFDLSGTVQINSSGIVDGILYWFEFVYSEDATLSTLEDARFNQCIQLCDKPVPVLRDQAITYDLKIVEGILDILLR